MSYALGGGASTESWTTPVVRKLLWANAIVYLLKLLTGKLLPWSFIALTPAVVLQKGYLWQFFTYMYDHFGITHLVFNLLGLFFFGSDVERVMGSRKFFWYYTICGIGAGILACVAYPQSTIVGASGAIYGILLAYAVFFPYRPVYLYGLAPIESRWLVFIYFLIDLGYSLEGGGNIAYLAHIGGLVTGVLYFWMSGQLKFPFLTRGSPTSRPNVFHRWLSSFRQNMDRRREEGERLTAAELDAILDKIAKNGMNSLTKSERDRLKNASHEMKSKGRESS